MTDFENPNRPALSFTCDFDDRTAWEVEQKGWFECAVVSLPEGTQVLLSFWDPVRLSQELKKSVTLGKSCLAEPAMIVVPRVTREFMERAVEELFKEGYFERLLKMGR